MIRRVGGASGGAKAMVAERPSRTASRTSASGARARADGGDTMRRASARTRVATSGFIAASSFVVARVSGSRSAGAAITP